MIELNYHVNSFENMGVLATRPHLVYDVGPRASLLKCVETTTAFFEFIRSYLRFPPIPWSFEGGSDRTLITSI